MPLPSPGKGEKQDKFVSRCMSNSQVKKDFPTQSQRSAVCFSRFRRSKANLTPEELEALATALPEGNTREPGKQINIDTSNRNKFKRKKDKFRKVRDEEVGSSVTGEEVESKTKKGKKKKKSKPNSKPY